MLAAFTSKAWRQLARRRRQLTVVWEQEGYRGFAYRMRKVAAEKIRPRTVELDVLPEDVLAADLTRRFTPPVFKRKPGSPFTLHWVITPSHPGSGGHTTTYRIITYLESRGFRNELYFYDPFGGDHQYYVEIARKEYGVTCPIRNAREGIRDADAIIATAWECAYAVYNSRCAGKRFYFVQDYEPAFYATGTKSLLAENTYRMGFHGITAGPWLAKKLSKDFGMETDFFPFGCDTRRYFVKSGLPRTGIAFYARASTPRRGVELGLLALELVARRNPGTQIHLFGGSLGPLPFPSTDHGVVTPSELNEIYNRCVAGLCLSLTNVSLVPLEMLAAGCIPVVNEAVHNRMVLDNSHVCYASPTPHALAAALERLIAQSTPASARQATESVVSASWEDAGAAVEACFRMTLGDADQSAAKPSMNPETAFGQPRVVSAFEDCASTPQGRKDLDV